MIEEIKEIRSYLEKRLDRIEAAMLLGTKEIIGIEEAALLTGYKVKGLYTLTSENRIPHYKKNGKLYFRKSELEAWLTENKVLTDAKIRSKAVTYVVTGRMK